MHRHKSLEPFTRHFTGQQFFDMLDIADNSLSSTIAIKPDSVDVFAPVLAKYKIARETQMILYVNFTSVVDYMWLLRAACECLAAFEERAVLYLAAAVSDFYIPEDMMVSGILLTLPLSLSLCCFALSCGKSRNWLHSSVVGGGVASLPVQELPGNCFLSICNVDWPPSTLLVHLCLLHLLLLLLLHLHLLFLHLLLLHLLILHRFLILLLFLHLCFHLHLFHLHFLLLCCSDCFSSSNWRQFSSNPSTCLGYSFSCCPGSSLKSTPDSLAPTAAPVQQFNLSRLSTLVTIMTLNKYAYISLILPVPYSPSLSPSCCLCFLPWVSLPGLARRHQP